MPRESIFMPNGTYLFLLLFLLFLHSAKFHIKPSHCNISGSLSALQLDINRAIILLLNQYCKWFMETRRSYFTMKDGIVFLYLILASVSLTHCDAERSMKVLNGFKQRKILINRQSKNLKVTKHDDLNPSSDSSNAQSYSVSSPFSLPPYESLAPIENSPPFCVNPPNPPYYYTSPALPTQNPPSGPNALYQARLDLCPPPQPFTVSSPPSITPGSPEIGSNPPIIIPGPSGSTISTPYYEPSPPSNFPSPIGGMVPSPPGFVPSPISGGGAIPSPIVFQPPVNFPPPNMPPPQNAGPGVALWCVAKPSVPDPILQEALNYACGSGADCYKIQPNRPCFKPNTVFAHASYAFNSYWQRNKVAGGTCDFGGKAMIVSIDPSYGGCHFVYV